MKEILTLLTELKTDMQDIKAELTELKQERGAQREEINNHFREIYEAIEEVRAESTTRTNLLNTRLFNVEGKVYR